MQFFISLFIPNISQAYTRVFLPSRQRCSCERLNLGKLWESEICEGKFGAFHFIYSSKTVCSGLLRNEEKFNVNAENVFMKLCTKLVEIVFHAIFLCSRNCSYVFICTHRGILLHQKIPFDFIQWRLLEYTWKFSFLEGKREERDSRRIRVFIGGKEVFGESFFLLLGVFLCMEKLGYFREARNYIF